MEIIYIVIPAIVVAFMLAGKWFTEHGMEWYNHSLILPRFTPPRWYFGIVWTILFFLTALSIIFWWQSIQTWSQFIFIGTLFVANGVFNVLWSYLFFYRRFIGLAVVDSGAIVVSLLLLIYFLWPVSPTSSLLLVPYLTWTIFATYLNLVIWWRN